MTTEQLTAVSQYLAEIDRLTAANRELVAALAGQLDYWQCMADDEQHTCGNHDGGSVATCEKCAILHVASSLAKLIAKHQEAN